MMYRMMKLALTIHSGNTNDGGGECDYCDDSHDDHDNKPMATTIMMMTYCGQIQQVTAVTPAVAAIKTLPTDFDTTLPYTT